MDARKSSLIRRGVDVASVRIAYAERGVATASIPADWRGAARSVAAGLWTVFRWLERQLQKRSTRLALLELNDDQLKDIGLSRGEAYGLSSSKGYSEALRRQREDCQRYR
jgi:uncharacterized protein YjiS (DUF1127 family)